MDGNPLQLSVVIDESVLRRQSFAPAGHYDPAIMRDQLDRLAAIAVRPNVTIQVLPFTAGLPPVTAGSFSVLASPAAAAPDVVYLENKTRVFFLDAEADVHRYIHEYGLLTTMALDPQASLSVIELATAAL